jgi:hypothetical protein
MRRILFTLVVSGALLALGPATALAGHHRHGRAHHRAHHRSHTRHHARVRFERFGSATSSQSGSTSGSAQGSDQSGQNAGTVTSFDNATRKLTITLTDGSTVSGKVTPDTELECQAAESAQMQRDDHGDDNGDRGDDNGSGDDNDNAEQEGNAGSCSTADLQPGTPVREAELRISSAGATWDKVDLITSSTAGNNDNDNDNEGGDS